MAQLSSSETHAPAYDSFGAWVKARRNALKWTQSKLAGRVGCSLDTLRAIEQNRSNYRPSIEMATRFAACLEIPTALREEFIELARRTGAAQEPPLESPAPPVGLTLALPPPVQKTNPPLQFGRALCLGIAPLSFLTLPIGLLLSVVLFGIVWGGWLVWRLVTAPQVLIVPPSRSIGLAAREPRVEVRVNGRLIANGETIARNTRVSVKFIVENFGDQSIPLGTIEAGARGPCAKRCDWNAAPLSFSRVRGLVLKPSEQYVYESSRVLLQPGYYFVEPVLQDTRGKYGGLAPFTRVEFQVGE